MYQGWLQLGPHEIGNNARVASYARSIVPRLAPSCDECDDLARLLGDGTYDSPALDGAPWYDPENPDTANFAGLYILSVAGVEDSTRSVPIVEGLFDGGAALRRRDTTKEVRVTGLLLARDEESLGVGREWLKSALDGSGCRDAGSGCESDDLCFLSSCPEVPEGSVDPLADPVEHPVSLSVGWDPQTGRWVSGDWTGFQVGSFAVGPELDPPCDDVVYLWRITPRDQHVVRLTAIDESDAIVADSGAVLLQRTNYARNPTFRTTTNFWTPGPNVTAASQPEFDRAVLENTVALNPGDAWIDLDSDVTTDAGEPWSARMRVELDPEGLVWDNLVPNPAVRTMNGWDTEATRDTDVFFTDSGSARLTVTDDDSDTLGSLSYGTVDDNYAVQIDGGQEHVFSAYVNTSIDATASINASYLDAGGAIVGAHLGVQNPVTADTWTRISETDTAPAAAVRMILAIGGTPVTVANGGDRMNVDALMVSPQAPLVDYFDGSYPDAFWTGLQHSSASKWSPSGDSACVQLLLETVGESSVSLPATLQPGVPQELTVSVPSSGAGAVGLRLVACDATVLGTRIYTSQVVLENAAEVGPYFSGATPPSGGYTSSWVAGPDSSHSVRQFLGPFELVVPAASGPIRPVITAVAGERFTTESLTASYRDEADPEDCLESFLRTLRNVATTDGPRTVQHYDTGCHGAMERVEFLLTAGVPWVYQRLREQFRTVGGTMVWPASDDCPADESLLPLNDPDCPLPPSPPRPPVISECVATVVSYERRVVAIPGSVLSPYQTAIPVITLRVNSATAVRQARIRFYQNPLDRDSIFDIDPCSYCGEFVVSYMPGRADFVIDGMVERAVVTLQGDLRKDATHLLYGTDGGPMTWPLLTCGTPYLMTVDTSPIAADVLTTSLQLVARS